MFLTLSICFLFLTGPVFIEFPIDVLYPYNMVAREVGMKGEAKSVMQKVVNWLVLSCGTLVFLINNVLIMTETVH